MTQSSETFRRYFPVFSVIFLFLFFHLFILHAQEDPDLIPKKGNQESEINRNESETKAVDANAEKWDTTTISLIVVGMLLGGFFLLLVEIAIIPGFGVVGIKGIILIVLALGLAFWKLDSRTAAVYTLVAFALLIALSLWLVFVFPHTRLGKRFILQTTISTEGGYVSTVDLSRFLGQTGISTSDLRPSGIARIGEERVDVMSEGDFIPKGTKLKAVRVKSGNVIVIPLPDDRPPTEEKSPPA